MDMLKAIECLGGELTYVCDCCCRHCLVADERYRCALALEILINFLEQLLLVDHRIMIHIEGGETCLYLYLSDALAYLAPKSRVFLEISATRPDVVRRIVDARYPLVWQVSLDRLGATHDDFRCASGLFDRVVWSLDCITKHCGIVYLNTVVRHRSLNELCDVVALAIWLRVRQLNFIGLMSVGKARENWRDLAISVDEAGEIGRCLRVARNRLDCIDILLAVHLSVAILAN